MKKCFDLYHNLTGSHFDIKKYFYFVACTREVLGPSRRWRVYGDIPGQITVLNRFMGWCVDAYLMDFNFGSLHPLQHGIKSEELRSVYNLTDHQTCSFSLPPEKHLQSKEEMLQRMRDTEQYFAFDTENLRNSDVFMVPKWPVQHCLVNWDCQPLGNDEYKETMSYVNEFMDGIIYTRPARVTMP